MFYLDIARELKLQTGRTVKESTEILYHDGVSGCINRGSFYRNAFTSIQDESVYLYTGKDIS